MKVVEFPENAEVTTWDDNNPQELASKDMLDIEAALRRRLLPSLASSGNLPPQQPSFSGDDDDRGCGFSTELISAYIDQELDADTENSVAQHLNSCPACAGVYAEMLLVDETIQVQYHWEWRDSTPLPLHVNEDAAAYAVDGAAASRPVDAIDRIMAMLPEGEQQSPVYAPRRVHARARWMRFPPLSLTPSNTGNSC